MKRAFIWLILICIFSSTAFGNRWGSRYSNPSYRSYSPYYGGSNWYLKSMIYENKNRINQNLNKVNNNEIKISRNSIKTGQNEAGIIQNAAKGLNNQSAIIQNAADIETLQAESNDGSSSETDPFKYVTRDGNGNVIGMSKITVDYSEGYSEVILKFSDDFQEVIIHTTGKLNSSTQNLSYESVDCTGKAYKTIEVYDFFVFKKFKGILITQSDALFYSPSDAPILSGLNIKSGSNADAVCRSSRGMSSAIYIEMLPNNPNVTGIYEYPFPLPITFEGMPTQ